MDQIKKASYLTILGSNPKDFKGQKPVIVSLTLPRLGEHDFKWVTASEIGKAYATTVFAFTRRRTR